MRLVLIATAIGLLAHPALAFQETTVGGGQPAAAPPAAPVAPPGTTLEFPSKPTLPSKGSGTEVRIPGIGTVGVLPKLDFGLELLYGASEMKGLPDSKIDPNDVQIRGTIKHRF